MPNPRVIIVADPDPEERARIHEVLDDVSTFLDVLDAADRTEIDAHLRNHDVALIITEVLLEGGSGYDLLRALSKREDENIPPVIFVTAMGRELDRYWALRNGAHAFLRKPYEDDRLRDRVNKALAGAPRDTPERT